MNELEVMQRAYIEAMYFTERWDLAELTAELTPLCRARALIDCGNFHRAVKQNVIGFMPAPLDWSRIGVDLWLTRNGHGAGFWDRPEVYGEKESLWLSAIAGAMGPQDAEFGDQP